MKTIFDHTVPQIKFEKFMQKIQTKVMISGLVFLAFIALRLIFNF